jgi:hypothetical protein
VTPDDLAVASKTRIELWLAARSHLGFTSAFSMTVKLFRTTKRAVGGNVAPERQVKVK